MRRGIVETQKNPYPGEREPPVRLLDPGEMEKPVLLPAWEPWEGLPLLDSPDWV
jgi:hypothetical protein